MPYANRESFFSGYKGAKIFYQGWISAPAYGQLIITHGHGEHSESYHNVIEALAPLGWSIFAWDWRGHGRSEGQRGFANSFLEYCYDFELFLLHLPKTGLLQKGLPLVLLGHSMGGLIQLRSLLDHPEWMVSAQVLSSPLLGAGPNISRLKEFSGHLIETFFPRLTISSGLGDERLTRDPEMMRTFEKDIFRHDRISAGVWFGALEAMEWVLSRCRQILTPTLMQVPEKDEVVSAEKSLLFFDQLPGSKILRVYSGHKHELYNDLGRQVALAHLSEYLQSSAHCVKGNLGNS